MLTSKHWQRIANLFDEVDWDKRTSQEVKDSFLTSSHLVVAYASDKIIGFGRTVDDGQFYALIVDVVVAPSYQEKGVGKTIIELLKKKLVGYNFVTLTSAPGKDGFYKKIGWKKQKSAYLWPKDNQQIEEHCEPE